MKGSLAAGVLFALSVASVASAGSATKTANPDRGRVYIWGYLGVMNGNAGPQPLGDPGSSPAFGLGGGSTRNRHLALEVDVIFDIRDYDVPDGMASPLLGSLDGLLLTSSSAFFTVKGVFPVAWFKPFIGVGVGFGYSEMKLQGSLLGIPGTFKKENDFGFAYQWVFGANFTVSERADLGFDFRNIEKKGDFGSLSEGSLKIGGQMISMSYTFRF